MPQGVTFSIPAQTRYNIHHGIAEQRNLAWLRHHQMLTDPDAIAMYSSWRIADLAARCWPDSTLKDLELAVDLKSFYFVFDDIFDGPEGNDLAKVANTCQALIDILHQEPSNEISYSVNTAFADLWTRSRDGMSSAWIARASYDWERYFASYPYEAINRRSRRIPTMDEYLAIRRGSAATKSVVDMVERLNRIEVPQVVFHSPQLRFIRKIAAEVPFICNDVYSYEKETARGDVYNLVTVLCHERQYSVQQAVAEIQTTVAHQVSRFFQLHDQVQRMMNDLGLDEQQRWSVSKYIIGLGDWLRGHNDWMVQTARYRITESADYPRHGLQADLSPTDSIAEAANRPDADGKRQQARDTP